MFSMGRSLISCKQYPSLPTHIYLMLAPAFGRSGSIRRASVEKEPSISYENFVHELDTGDSFTASIIDILVKVRSFTLTGVYDSSNVG